METRSNGRRYQHQGLDIEAAPNTPIFSVADGRIAFIIDPPRSDYGRQLCIIVQVDDLPLEKALLCRCNDSEIGEVYFFYAHLSAIHSGLERETMYVVVNYWEKLVAQVMPME
ncbi:M23 family metallopeptidase [Klebsiella pneumoniae subsp. pneumoniae]|nr:M23 family metallopeptidase [Klebsiella pneumoniae subsp. pneumoniae]